MLYLLQFYWFRFLNPLSIWCSHLRLKELLVYTHKFRVFRVTLYNVAMQITYFENTLALRYQVCFYVQCYLLTTKQVRETLQNCIYCKKLKEIFCHQNEVYFFGIDR